MNGELAELILRASADYLPPRSQAILDLRLGLTSGEPQTLASVGDQFGLTRERIRQIVNQSGRRLRSRGLWQLRSQDADGTCAALQIYLATLIRGSTAATNQQLWDLIGDDPLQVAAFVVSLLCYDRSAAAEYMRSFESYRAQLGAETAKQRRDNRRNAAFATFMEHAVYWPQTGHSVSVNMPTRRCREVSPDGEGEAGCFFSPKLGRDVYYESQLERAFFQTLEDTSNVIYYQEQPFMVPYELEGMSRAYYPDVFFLVGDGRAVVAEIKRRDRFALTENRCKWAALKEFCWARGFGVAVTDGRHHLRSWMREPAPTVFRDALLSALDKGALDWPSYRRLKEQYGATYDDFQRVVLQHRLVWYLAPFFVARGSEGTRAGGSR